MESTPQARRFGRRVRSIVWRGRFVVAAVCCGIAAAVTVQALRPPDPPTREIVVTSRDLPAGATLRAADLTTRDVTAGLAPDLLTDTSDAVGRTPAVPLPAGVPLHADLVAGGGLTAQAPDGTVVAGVQLSGTGWLRPGDHVDLLAADDDGTHLARRALVLPGLAPDEGPGAGSLLEPASPAAGGDTVTLVAVDPDEAAALAAAGSWGAVAAVLVP